MVLNKISKSLVKVFGSRNERVVKAYMQIALQAQQYEENLKTLSDEQLKDKTAQFKQALSNGSKPEDILPEVFAVVREAGRRNIPYSCPFL